MVTVLVIGVTSGFLVLHQQERVSVLDQIYLGLVDLFPGSDDSLFASSPSKPKVRAKPPTDAASDAWFDAVAYAATKDQLAVVENLLVTGAASGAGQ